MADKTIGQRLKDQMQASDDYQRMNFGAKIGSGFPELVLSTIDQEVIARFLVTVWGVDHMSYQQVVNVLRSVGPDSTGVEICRRLPEVYTTPLGFLYWGIEIGRQLEREQASVLASIAEDAAKGGS